MKNNTKKIVAVLILSFLLNPQITAQQNDLGSNRGGDSVRRVISDDRTREMIAAGGGRQQTIPAVRANNSDDERMMREQIKVITGNDEEEYIITDGDTIIISFNDRDFVNTAIYHVVSTGEVFLPLAGAVKISGSRRKEAQSKISKALEEYIRQPDVKIEINNNGRFMIVGAVNAPGIYNFGENLTVMEAILTAGSFDDKTAELKSVLVMRGARGNPYVARLNLKKMIRKGDRSDNIFIKPGDMIFVPTKLISSVDKFMGDLYRYVLMWYGFGGQDIVDEGDPFFGPINL